MARGESETVVDFTEIAPVFKFLSRKSVDSYFSKNRWEFTDNIFQL